MLKPFYSEGILEAGCDEAGRGCIAGPVYAAAVILPIHFHNSVLDDSKKLSRKKRRQLRLVIEQEAISWGVGVVDEQEIDQINILNASFLAMHRALEKLRQRPEHLLIDGNRFKAYGNIPYSCIVKGDGIYASIAAASILAKTHRDEYMEALHQKYKDQGLVILGFPCNQFQNQEPELNETMEQSCEINFGANLRTGMPSGDIRNFVKFHLILFPNFPGS